MCKVLMGDLDTFSAAVRKYKNKKAIFFLDFDGTLAPIQSDPSSVALGDENLALLKKLCTRSQTEVVVVSGRDLDFLQDTLAGIPASISAEHGRYFLRSGTDHPIDLFENQEGSRSGTLTPFFTSLVAKHPGTALEEKQSSLAFHYRNLINKEMELDIIQSIRSNISEHANENRVIYGNKVIEVLDSDSSKGSFVTWALNNEFPEDYGLKLAVGDDVTDESMFVAISSAGGCSVHIRNPGTSIDTKAGYVLEGQPEVTKLLRVLCAI